MGGEGCLPKPEDPTWHRRAGRGSWAGQNPAPGHQRKGEAEHGCCLERNGSSWSRDQVPPTG